MAPKRDASQGYIRFPSMFWTVTIVFGLSFFYMETYRPDLIPYKSLGPLGDPLIKLRENYLTSLDIGFKVAVGLHILEATYAFYLSRKKELPFWQQLFWFVQTFIIGFPSTKLIMAYKNKKE
ncbi:Transmembrane protein 254c [Trichoplax sp. H2]|nr:Transmembrane protein 254c [Trichoplax sp. H2]|eukprot:RDD46675.1 Transmembrane protein 254c [Trichoplax sp. H2]